MSKYFESVKLPLVYKSKERTKTCSLLSCWKVHTKIYRERCALKWKAMFYRELIEYITLNRHLVLFRYILWECFLSIVNRNIEMPIPKDSYSSVSFKKFSNVTGLNSWVTTCCWMYMLTLELRSYQISITNWKLINVRVVLIIANVKKIKLATADHCFGNRPCKMWSQI